MSVETTKAIKPNKVIEKMVDYCPVCDKHFNVGNYRTHKKQKCHLRNTMIHEMKQTIARYEELYGPLPAEEE